VLTLAIVLNCLTLNMKYEQSVLKNIYCTQIIRYNFAQKFFRVVFIIVNMIMFIDRL